MLVLNVAIHTSHSNIVPITFQWLDDMKWIIWSMDSCLFKVNFEEKEKEKMLT